MAISQVNTYAVGDAKIDKIELALDYAFKSKIDSISITELYTATAPKISTGSVIENNGALFYANADETISTTDPYTSATVADGIVYIIYQISGTTLTAAFTATAPTWSDNKQGWYGTGAQSGNRYSPYMMLKSSTSYTNKYFTFGNSSDKMIYFASDATERSTTSTSFVYESNLSISIVAKAYEIWEVFMLYNAKGPVSTFPLITIKNSTGSNVVSITNSTATSANEPYKSISGNGAYATLANFALCGIMNCTTDETSVIKQYWNTPYGTVYVKDRIMFARKIK